MILKHFFGFLTLLFFVMLSISDVTTFTSKLVLCSVLYLWFLLTTRCHIYFWVPIILLMATAYLLDIYKKSDLENNESDNFLKKIMSYEKTEQIQSILLYVAFSLTIIGSIIYFIQKYIEYGDDFSILTFIVGNTYCKNNTDLQPSLIEAVKKVLKIRGKKIEVEPISIQSDAFTDNIIISPQKLITPERI